MTSNASFLDSLRRDIRYALRRVAREPGLAATIAITFAIGIGANATMFGIVDRLLLRGPANVANPGTLVRVESKVRFRGREFTNGNFSYPAYAEIRDGIRGFSSAAAQAYVGSISLGLGSGARGVEARLISGTYFQTLGARVMLGRPILPADDRLPSGSPVVVISHRLWVQEFGAEPGAVGATLLLGGRRYTVVGVAPPGFVGVQYRPLPVDVWIPIAAAEGLRFPGDDWTTDRRSRWVTVFGRLAPGRSPAAVASQATIAVRAANAAVTGRTDTTSVIAFASVLWSKQRTLSGENHVAVLLGVMSLAVLLIACSNVANLLLSRALRRRREIAIRLALGLSRVRLVRQLLVEVLLLATLGGVAALAVARAGSELVRRALLSEFAWPDSPFDGHVLVFAAVVTLLTGLLTGLVPSLQTSTPDLTRDLREGSRGTGVTRSRTRATLLLAQAALCAVLLTGTGLFVRSLWGASRFDFGMDLDRLVVGTLDLGSVGIDSAGSEEYFRQAVAQARRLPGVADAVVAEGAPLGTGLGARYSIPGRDSVPRFENGLHRHGVSPNYFATVGTPILRGRAFSPVDLIRGAPPVAIINEAAARVIWPGEDALGRCMRVGAVSTPCAEIIGIAGDIHDGAIAETGRTAQVYLPFGTPIVGPRAYVLILRARDGVRPDRLVAPLRRMMQAVMSGLPYADVWPARDGLNREMRPWRLGATIFGIFGTIALMLSALGLYSVVSHAVVERMHEMGVRLALGAPRHDIVRLVMSRGLRTVAIGVGMGLVLALAAGRFVQPLLYAVSAHDTGVYVVVGVVLVGAATIASLIPVRRAMRADPLDVLRAE
jgi:putative ABC transport system permease protein